MALKFALAEVVDNNPSDGPEGQGLIRVKIDTIDPERLFTAKPVYPPLCGWEGIPDKPEAHMGVYMVPPVGGWVLVLFDDASLSDIYYLGSVYPPQMKPYMGESALPDAHKRVVLARTPSGKSIVISESPLDNNIRITGRKTKYQRQNPASSVLPIKGNQSVILIDGNNDNVYVYSLNDVIIENDNARIHLTKSGNILIEGSGSITIKAPTVVVDGNLSISGNETIGGSQAPSGCKCPCGLC